VTGVDNPHPGPGVFARFREPVNGLSHLAAALLALLGMAPLLILARGDTLKQASLVVYGITLVLMFLSSGLYHSIHAGPRASLLLKKFDHSAIYLLIAGTYTPICLYFFSGFWRGGFLMLVWLLALTGIGVKLVVIHAPRWLTAGVYLVMGWMALFAVREIFSSLPPGAIGWLVLGGLFFTVGAGVYIAKRPVLKPGVFGFHELWHVFVILGAFSHYALVLGYIAPA